MAAFAPAGLGFALGAGALAQSLPQYQVTASVRTLQGGVPGAGDMVRVELGYLDPASGKPAATTLRPVAFLRTVRPGQGDCATAVRAYSLNKGMFRDSFSLVGQLIVAANADGSVAFVDPLANLATANIFEVVQLPEPVSQIAAFQGDVAALLPKVGAVMLVDTSGKVRTVASGIAGLSRLVIAEPVLLAVAGRAVMGFDEKGTPLFRREAEAKIVDVVPLANSQSAEAGASDLAVLDQSGKVQLIGVLDGIEQPIEGVPGPVRLIAGNGAAMVMARREPSLFIHYVDGQNAVSVDLGFVPAGLVADGIGRHAFAWSEDGLTGAVVDLVRGKVADTFSLPKAPAKALFSGRSLFLSHISDADLTLIDTGPLTGEGGKVAMRTYKIQAREPGPTPMTVHDPDSGWIIGLPRGLSTANVYGNGNPTAPMTTTPLRGGLPLETLSLDRNFRRTGDGRFVAQGRLPAAAPVQLVTMADNYKTIRCFDIESTAPVPAPEPELVLLTEPSALAGEPFVVRLRIANDVKGMASRLSVLRLTIRDMFGNKKDVIAERQADGSFTFPITVGAAGQYPVSAELDGIVRPSLLTVGDGT